MWQWQKTSIVTEVIPVLFVSNRTTTTTLYWQASWVYYIPSFLVYLSEHTCLSLCNDVCACACMLACVPTRTHLQVWHSDESKICQVRPVKREASIVFKKRVWFTSGCFPFTVRLRVGGLGLAMLYTEHWNDRGKRRMYNVCYLRSVNI